MKQMLLLALLAISVAGCAQVNKSIVKATAFYTIPTPGTIPVDDAGRPLTIQRNKVYSLFLEVKENSMEWTKAWTDNKLFNVISFPLKGSSVVIGKKRSDEEKIAMKAGQGNSLVQLEFSPNKTYQKPPQTLLLGQVLLQGKWKGKTFYYKIPKVIELASPEYQ